MEAHKRATGSAIAVYFHTAMQKLARVCDGAVALDGQGFNKLDSERGHRFASEDPATWDENKVRYVGEFLRKPCLQFMWTATGIFCFAFPTIPKRPL